MRTRATRALGLAYRLLEFEAEAYTAAEAAERLGLPPEQIFKTLVVRSDHGEVFLASIPGSRDLNLRALARCAGVKRVEMADPSELMRLVGYIKGAVSPLGTRRRYRVFIDASALDHAHISVSAGVRGLQIWIDPRDLIQATGAQIEPLAASGGQDR